MASPIRLYRRIRRNIRSFFGRDIRPRIDIRKKSERYGSGYGEWYLIPSLLNKDSVVYSFGIGHEISFDLGIIEHTGATVHAFDPTPGVREWLAKQSLTDQFIYHAEGLAAKDGTLIFYPPENPNHISHSSALPTPSNRNGIPLQVSNITTILQRLGHNHIDLLKMDIEGSEYEVIHNFQNHQVRPTQLLVEFHHRWPELGIGKTKEALRILRKLGYKVYHVSDTGEEYSLILE